MMDYPVLGGGGGGGVEGGGWGVEGVTHKAGVRGTAKRGPQPCPNQLLISEHVSCRVDIGYFLLSAMSKKFCNNCKEC